MSTLPASQPEPSRPPNAPAPAKPRSHVDPAVLSAHRRLTGAPHVAPLNALAAEIAAEVGQPVPVFDPTSGGIHARALLFLESPGPASTADRGSGIISPHNGDPTAERVHTLLTANGIPFDAVTHWNVVPWFLPATSGGSTFRAPRVSDIEAAAPWLEKVLGLLPDLETIVTLGRKAQHGLDRYARQRPLPFRRIACPHPGSRAWNRPKLRAATEAAFVDLARLLAEAAGDDEAQVIDHWP